MNVGVKRTVAVIVFLCLLGTLLLWAGEFCIFTGENSEKKCWDLFYSLKDEQLNAVIIGSSAAYTFYNHAQAYNEHQLCSVPITSSAQPIETVPYVVREVEKYKNTELIVVELRALLRNDCHRDDFDMDERMFYRALSLLAMNPFSQNRIKGVFEQLSGREGTPYIEYLFPILQYHDNIYSLSFQEILRANDIDFENYFGIKNKTDVEDLAEEVKKLRAEEPTKNLHLSEYNKGLLDEIADIVASCGNELLFILTPFGYTEDDRLVSAEIKAYMDEKNYSFLDCNEYAEEIGMDFSTDYFDLSHTNVVGAHKFTSWFAKYLREHYEFESKTSEKMQDKWQNLADNWKNTYSEYVDQMKQKQTS